MVSFENLPSELCCVSRRFLRSQSSLFLERFVQINFLFIAHFHHGFLLVHQALAFLLQVLVQLLQRTPSMQLFNSSFECIVSRHDRLEGNPLRQDAVARSRLPNLLPLLNLWLALIALLGRESADRCVNGYICRCLKLQLPQRGL